MAYQFIQETRSAALTFARRPPIRPHSAVYVRPLLQDSTFRFSLALVRNLYAMINKHHREDLRASAGTLNSETLLVHRVHAKACTSFAAYDERLLPLDAPSRPHPAHEGPGRGKAYSRSVWP